MSQFDFGNLSSPLSGTEFIDDNLESWRDALHSLHSGVSRPSYAVAGLMWIDTSVTPWLLKVFQGSDDIILGTLDSATLAFTPSGAQAMAANTVKVRDDATTGAPSDLAMGASTILARLASGNIVAASVAQIRTLLGLMGGAFVNVAAGGTGGLLRADGDGSGLVGINSITPQGTTTLSGSGTLIQNIPNSTKRITGSLVGVQPSAGGRILLRIGSGSVVSFYNNSWAQQTNSTSYGDENGGLTFIVAGTGTRIVHSWFELNLIDSENNTWEARGGWMNSGANGGSCYFIHTLSSGNILDRLNISLTSGTFSSGSLNLTFSE